MGYFDAMTSGIYRYTRDGRRIFTFRRPFSKSHYLVSDQQAPLLQLRWRRVHQAALVLMGVGALLSSWLHLSWPWLILPAGLTPWLLRRWLVRELPDAHVASLEFLPRDRRAEALRTARAAGEPILWLALSATLAMGALGISVAIMEGLWEGWLMVGFMLVAGFHMARQLYLLRHSGS